MQQIIFLIIFTLSVSVQALTFDSNLYCSCESLTVDECQYGTRCKVNGGACTTYEFSCGDLTETECTSSYTKCIWESSSCNDYSYSCSDFNSDQTKCQKFGCEWKNSSCNDYDYTCSQYSEKDCSSSYSCYWNKDGKCEEFSSCENYSYDKCPQADKYGCLKKNDTCSTLVCSDITTETDCRGNIDEDTRCAWNNDNKCVELPDEYICTDLDDFTKRCQDYGCIYSNGSCNFKTCTDYALDNCELKNAYVGRTEYNLCTVLESKCVELTDTTKLTKDNCRYETSYNYHWTKEGKCEECAELLSRDSQSIIIMGIIMMTLLVA